jgi:hypothetical protein
MDATAWAPVVATRDLCLSDLTGDGIAADVLTIQAMLNQIAWLQSLYDTFGYDLDSITSVYGGTSLKHGGGGGKLGQPLVLQASSSRRSPDVAASTSTT